MAVVLVETIGSAVRRAEVLDAESQEWAYTDWEEDPAVKVLQGYLRVDTNWQTGSELAGAQYLAGLLEEAGIEPDSQQLTRISQHEVESEDAELAAKVLKFLEAVDDHDDVQSVSSNLKVSDEVMAAVEAAG